PLRRTSTPATITVSPSLTEAGPSTHFTTGLLNAGQDFPRACAAVLIATVSTAANIIGPAKAGQCGRLASERYDATVGGRDLSRPRGNARQASGRPPGEL